MPRPYTKDPAKQRMIAAITVIRRQAQGDTGARLMFAVFEQAARDAVSNDPAHCAESAAEYLEGAMPHLEYCGIDPVWARAIFCKAGLRLGSYNAMSLQDSAPPPA